MNVVGSRQAWRHAGIYVGAAILSGLIPFFLMPILTRLLGPTEFGIVGTFSALVSIVSILVGLSTHGLISIKYFRDGPDSISRYVGASLLVLIASSLLVGLCLVASAATMERLSGVARGWQWTILVASVGQFVVAIALAVWQVEKRVWRFGVMQVASTALNMVGTIGLVVVLGYGWEGRALSQAAAAAMVGAVALILLVRAGSVSLGIRASHVRESLRFGLPLVPHAIAGIALVSADRFIITDQRGSGEAGLYFAAFQIASVFTLFSAGVNQAFMPWLFERLAANEDAGARVRVVKVTLALFALLAAGGVVVSIGAPWIIYLLAGEGYQSAVPYLRLLAPAAAINGMYYFVTNYIFFANRTELLSLITGFTAIVQVGATVVLVGRLGALGAAMAALGSAIIYFSLTLAVAQLCVPMPWIRAYRAA